MKIRLLIALIFITSCSVAQEKLTVDEITRWFPSGDYVLIEHVDIENASKAKGYQEYLDTRGGSRERLSRRYRMPDFLTSKWTSVTRMTYSKTKAYLGNEKLPDRSNMVARFNIDGKMYTAISNGSEMTVLRFPADYELAKALRSHATIVKTDEQINGQKLYHFEYQYKSGSLYSLYVYISADNELLYCEDLDHLKMMVRAGLGENIYVDLEHSFPGVPALIPDLSYHWNFMKTGSLLQAIYDRAEKEGADNEAISGLAGMLKSMRMRGSEYIVGEPIKSRTFTFFDTEEEALKHQAIRNEDNAKNRTEGKLALANNTKTELKDTIFISTLTHTPEYLKYREKQMEDMEREQEKKQKKINKMDKQKSKAK